MLDGYREEYTYIIAFHIGSGKFLGEVLGNSGLATAGRSSDEPDVFDLVRCGLRHGGVDAVCGCCSERV